MSPETKLQVERKVVEVLGELYGEYTPIDKVESMDREWLKSIGVSLDRNPLHDASGANGDYPVGRGIFQDE